MTEDERLIALKQSIVRRPRHHNDGICQPFRVARATDITAAETIIGFALPKTLARLYAEVANGGFGPGAGLLGVDRGQADEDGRTLGPAYAALVAQSWPAGHLPLFDLGCGAWACVDGATADDRLVVVDGDATTRIDFTLLSLLEDWLAGADWNGATFEMIERPMTNPFTKRLIVVKTRGRVRPARDE